MWTMKKKVSANYLECLKTMNVFQSKDDVILVRKRLLRKLENSNSKNTKLCVGLSTFHNVKRIRLIKRGLRLASFFSHFFVYSENFGILKTKNTRRVIKFSRRRVWSCVKRKSFRYEMRYRACRVDEYEHYEKERKIER